MPNQLAIDVKGYTNFVCSIAVGSRPFLRFLKTACVWAQELTEKTYVTFFSYELDVKALHLNLLKPLDNQIYIIKAVGGILDIQEKFFDRFFTLEGMRHGMRTSSDLFASFRCFALFGVVAFTPYVRQFSIAKNSFGLSSGLIGLIIRVRDLVRLVHRPIKTDQEAKKANYEWLGLMLLVGVSVCSIQLNFFALCKALTKDIVKLENQMPGVVLNFLRTGSSIFSLSHIAVEYFTPQ